MTTAAILLIAAGVVSVAVTLYAIGRAHGERVGRAEAEWRLARRARADIGHQLEPRHPAEAVTVIRYPEPLWPTEEKSVIYDDAYDALLQRDPDELRSLSLTPLQRDRLERFLNADDKSSLTARTAGAAFLAGQP